MENYLVQGREVQANPSREHLVPSSLYDRDNYNLRLAEGGVDFVPLPIAEFLRSLDEGLGGPLDRTVSIYLKHCRTAVEFIRSTQDTARTRLIEEGEPVTPPSSSENIKILDGLENTIRVLEQLEDITLN